MADTNPLGFGGEFYPGAEAPDTTPTVADLEEAKKLPEGSFFIGPDKQKHQRPFQPKTPDEAAVLPEGAYYLTPEGDLRQQPTYQGLDFTTQTLYNMAATETERKKALERGYPGKVKQNKHTSELYVEDEGIFRRAKGFTDAPGAFLTAQAAPIIGTIGGEIGGAAAGSVLPGPGTFAGAVGGGAIGGAAGQAFNDAMLSLSGVYDRTGGEEAAEMGGAALFGGVGTAGGRFLGAAFPAVKAAVTKTLPKFVADVLGADPEGLKFAVQMRQKGVMVPPSIWAKEAPHIINMAEVFDPAFRTQKPLLESAAQHYESGAWQLLKQFGVQPTEKISEPTAAISTEQAGITILKKTRADLAAADAKLEADFAARRTALAEGKATESDSYKAHMAALENSAAESRAAAQKVIDEGFNDIRRSTDEAMGAAKAGHNSGDLWWNVGEKLKAVRASIAGRASTMYDMADELAGGLIPDTAGLSQVARDFLQEIPENFQAQYPMIVAKIRDWAGQLSEDGTKFVKEPVQPSWAQLHNLRTVMRQNYNRLDLTPNVKQGTFKFFANKVDEIISRETGDPRLAAAAKQLREADNFYRDNMGPLTDTRIQAVLDGLSAGLPADPKVLYDVVVKEGRTELTNKIRDLVGPTLWAGVKAADVREMLEQSKTLVPGQIDGKRFAQQVVERYRNGTLESVHQETAERLLKQAQDVAMLDGRLDLAARPTDSVRDIIAKARQAAEAVKAAAKQDPLGTLKREISVLDREKSLAARDVKTKRANDPLGFLYDLKLGAHEAVNRILDHEDLILAAANKFGANSSEFNALRQVFAQRILMGTLEPGSRLAKVSEEVQRIMFPGVSLDQMRLLAKEMDFLMSSRASRDTAKSMAAVSHVEHPWGYLSKSHLTKLIPGSDFVGRLILGKYFQMVTQVFNNPAFLRYIEKGLTGTPEQRLATRELIARRMQTGGMLGAGLGQAEFQTPNESTFFQ